MTFLGGTAGSIQENELPELELWNELKKQSMEHGIAYILTTIDKQEGYSKRHNRTAARYVVEICANAQDVLPRDIRYSRNAYPDYKEVSFIPMHESNTVLMTLIKLWIHVE